MGWLTQDDNEDAVVRVRAGSHGKEKETITEFIVADKKAKEHHHLGINEQGKEVFNNPPKKD